MEVKIDTNELFKFVDWVSVNRYQRTIAGEWFQNGIDNYTIVAKNTEELYLIYKKETEST